MLRDARNRSAYEDALEYLCRHAESLRTAFSPADWTRYFTAVRDTQPATDAWRSAILSLHTAAVDANIPGGLGLGSTMSVGDWPAGPPPRAVGWVCPTGGCPRVDLPDGNTLDSPGPLCALTGGPLRPVD